MLNSNITVVYGTKTTVKKGFAANPAHLAFCQSEEGRGSKIQTMRHKSFF